MGPMDIVDSIVSAGSAAAAVSAYIREHQKEAVYA
jgi:heterodisulfide reductase subunit A-like polyferredoxin